MGLAPFNEILILSTRHRTFTQKWTLAHIQQETREMAKGEMQCCADLPTNLMF